MKKRGILAAALAFAAGAVLSVTLLTDDEDANVSGVEPNRQNGSLTGGASVRDSDSGQTTGGRAVGKEPAAPLPSANPGKQQVYPKRLQQETKHKVKPLSSEDKAQVKRLLTASRAFREIVGPGYELEMFAWGTQIGNRDEYRRVGATVIVKFPRRSRFTTTWPLLVYKFDDDERPYRIHPFLLTAHDMTEVHAHVDLQREVVAIVPGPGGKVFSPSGKPIPRSGAKFD